MRTYLVNVWSNQVIKFVEDTINDFNQQMTFLVLQCRRHQQGQDLVKEGPRTKLSGFICDLTKSSLKGESQLEIFFQRLCYSPSSVREDTNLSHGRGSILDLQEQLHDFALLLFFWTEGGLINFNLQTDWINRLQIKFRIYILKTLLMTILIILQVLLLLLMIISCACKASVIAPQEPPHRL